MPAALDRIAVAVFPSADSAHTQMMSQFSGVHALSVDKAFEWESEASQEELSAALPQADVAVMPREGRRKRLLICDMDSTLIGQECIDELADFAGVKDRVSAITERAMRGEIGFEGALRERVALLKGLPTSVIERCYAERITLNKGARVLARTMAAHGAKTVIVSGGFTAFSAKVAAAAGFNHHQANVLLSDGETLSGTVAEPILGREAKREALLAYVEHGVETALAIGDGANDLAMIQAAGMGVAYYAKPAVAEAAGYAIGKTDLTSALYFQGYRDEEFVRD